MFFFGWYDVLSFARQAFSSFHTSMLSLFGDFVVDIAHMRANCFSVTLLGIWLLRRTASRRCRSFGGSLLWGDGKNGCQKRISDIYWQWLSLFLCFCIRFGWLVCLHFVCHFVGCLFTFCLPLFENKSRMRQWQAEIHSYRRDEQYVKDFSFWELVE